MLVVKKAKFSLVPTNKEVQKPGSRGSTHWYYDQNHQVQYGDPPSGHMGFHSGDYHEMFVRHMPNQTAARYAHSLVDVTQRPQDLATQAMGHTTRSHKASLEKLREAAIEDPTKMLAYEQAVEKFGQHLEAIHAGAIKHGFDKDEKFTTEYMKGRREHAQYLVDTGKTTPKIPTPEELKAWPFPKTHQDIIKMANTWLPHTHFDIEDMDLETADTLVYQFFAMASQGYPEEMFRSLQHFGSRSKNSNHPEDWENDETKNQFAHMYQNNTILGFNPRFTRNIAEFRKEVDHNMKVGWLVSGEVKHIVTHEFGHMIDNYYSNDPQWSNLMLDFKQAHAITDASSGYARFDDSSLEEFDNEYRETRQKPPGWRPMYERREQWAESFVAGAVRKHENLSEYELHQQRLIDFIHKNPDVNTETYPFTKKELEYLGIHVPSYVHVEGEDYG